MTEKVSFRQSRRGARISLDHRVLVLAAMKMRSEGTPLKKFRERLPTLPLRLPINERVELDVAMGAAEGRTLETIVAALRPLAAQG